MTQDQLQGLAPIPFVDIELEGCAKARRRYSARFDVEQHGIDNDRLPAWTEFEFPMP